MVHAVLRLSVLVTVMVLMAAGVAMGAEVAPHSIAVIHRHGARTGMGIKNGKTSCAAPHCALTDKGKEMCVAVGKNIRERYFHHFDLLDREYNVSFIHSESTAVPRVVVSGEAAVIGMFGADALPFVDYVHVENDLKMSPWTSWPAWRIRETYSVEEKKNNEKLTAANISLDVLDHISELYPGLNCTANPIECIVFAQDTLAANRSAGNPLDKLLETNWPALRRIVAQFFADLLAYDPEDHYDSQIGSLGFPFANHILSHLNEAVATNSLQRVHHFACHDWTLIALYSALGIWVPSDANNGDFVPRFSETLVLEQRIMDGKNYITALRGYPTQEDVASSEYKLDLSIQNVRCTTEGGTTYVSGAHPLGCPIADVWRYVNSTKPQSEAGICYATDEDLELQGCLNTTAPANASRCYFYRDKCPAQPCANIPGAMADIAEGFACAVPEPNSYLATTIIALVVPFALLGSIAGFYVAPKIGRAISSKKEGTDETTRLAQ